MAESGGTLALDGYLSYVKGTSTNNERILLKIRILVPSLSSYRNFD
jgi:hypothetical protein